MPPSYEPDTRMAVDEAATPDDAGSVLVTAVGVFTPVGPTGGWDGLYVDTACVLERVVDEPRDVVRVLMVVVELVLELVFELFVLELVLLVLVVDRETGFVEGSAVEVDVATEEPKLECDVVRTVVGGNGSVIEGVAVDAEELKLEDGEGVTPVWNENDTAGGELNPEDSEGAGTPVAEEDVALSTLEDTDEVIDVALVLVVGTLGSVAESVGPVVSDA